MEIYCEYVLTLIYFHRRPHFLVGCDGIDGMGFGLNGDLSVRRRIVFSGRSCIPIVLYPNPNPNPKYGIHTIQVRYFNTLYSTHGPTVCVT